MGLAETLRENPGVKWGIVAVLALVAAVLIFRTMGSAGDVHSPASMRQMVKVHSKATGDTWEMQRSDLEQLLYARAYSGSLSLDSGVPNPTNGNPDGFPNGWKDMVERVKRETDEVKARQGQ